MIMSTISLCMITKNEEAFLESCLLSVKDLVDEIIVVDTGSTDKTKEIALKHNAKVFDFAWCDNFAAARNESLKHATGDWILILDADEELDKEGINKIKAELQNPSFLAYSMPQLHYTNKFMNQANFVQIENPEFKGFYVSDVVRLFKKDNQIYFDYCVHETLRVSLKNAGIKLGEMLSPIHHYQERKGMEDVHRKQEFYYRLSLKNIEQYPTYAKSYHDVGIYFSTYKNDQGNALIYCSKAVELEPNNLSYVLNLSYRLRDLGKLDEAMEVLQKVPKDEQVFRAMGYLYFAKRQFKEARDAYSEAINLGSPIKERLLSYIKILNTKINEINK